MNVDRLLLVIDMATNLDLAFELQVRLSTLAKNLSRLAANPQDANLQTNVVSATDAVSSAFFEADKSIDTLQSRLLSEIGGARFFNGSFAIDLKRRIAENGVSPALLSEFVSKFQNERSTYLTRIREIGQRLIEVGFESTFLPEGVNEVGFSIPRELFGNNTDGLRKEIGVINHILTLFAEVSGEQPAPPELRSISTSDLLIYVAASIFVIKQIASSITWILETIKSVKEIQKVAADAEAIGITGKDLDIFSKRIEKRIEEALDSQKTELLQGVQGARKNELKNGLDWVLRSLMSRVERGMTVEVRFIAPPEDAAIDPKQKQAYQEAASYAESMKFPEIGGAPLLQIPSAPGDQAGGAVSGH